jgi:hypothetical protein
MHKVFHRKRSGSICLSVFLLLSTAVACATEIYTWVDDSGITHFSETPPAADATGTQIIDIAPTATPESVMDDDFYSVVNQAERMEARRLENEKLAAEKKQAEAEASKAHAEAAAIQKGDNTDNVSDNSQYYPVYPYYPYGYHPGRPGHGHKPVHPVYPVVPRPKNPRTSLGKTPGMPGQKGSWR